MPELNDEQSREVNRVDKLLSFLNLKENKNSWIHYTPFKNKVNLLTANLTSILALATVKEQTGKGITITKEQYKLSFSMLLGDMFDKTREFAIEIGDAELEAKVSLSENDIFKLKDAEILPLAVFMRDNVYINDLMNNATFITYEVTFDNVSNAYNLAVNFNSKIGSAPSVMILSNTANIQINELIGKIRMNISSLTRLIGHFRDSNQPLFKGFFTASRRDDIGVRHTGINATITLAGVGVQGGKITIGKKSVTSDLLGKCPPIHVTTGNKEIICELLGHQIKRIIYHFIRGHMDDMTFNF